MVNKANLLRLADAIEKGELAERGIGFNMTVWLKRRDGWAALMRDHTGHDCGTVACIGGTAQVLFNTTEIESPLGLSDEQAAELISPGPIPAMEWPTITTAHAAAVIRHLAETGEVDWLGQDPRRKAGEKQT